MNDPRSPYHLTGSDGPGNLISSVILNEQNYGNWSKVVINALRTKNKLVFVTGALKRPTESDPDVFAWDKCNSMVIAWLCNVISPNLHATVTDQENAAELWAELAERYAQSNQIRVHQLKEDITLTRQGPNQTITNYYTTLKSLWEELNAYQNLPLCKCDAAENYKKVFEDERVHKFLMGLDTHKYMNARSNLLAIEPLPTLNKAYAYMLREERHQMANTRENEPKPLLEGAALKVTGGVRDGHGGLRDGLRGRSDGQRPRSSHCQKLGHQKNECFELVGYPSDWVNRRTPANRRNGDGWRGGERNRFSNSGLFTDNMNFARENGEFCDLERDVPLGSHPALGRETVGKDTFNTPRFSENRESSGERGFAGLGAADMAQLFEQFKAFHLKDKLSDTVKPETLSGPYLEDADWSG